MTTMGSPCMIAPPLWLGRRLGLDEQDEPVDPRDPDMLTAMQMRVAAHLPSFAVHTRPPPSIAVLDELPARADQLFAPAHHRPFARLQRHADEEEEEQRRADRKRRNQRPRDLEARHVGLDQHDRAEHERDYPTDCKRTIGCDEQLRDEK